MLKKFKLVCNFKGEHIGDLYFDDYSELTCAAVMLKVSDVYGRYYLKSYEWKPFNKEYVFAQEF